ncbi:amidohydrolase family protein [Maricaulis sp.]|uniref:amidohydrolase family protein n=1 Tax=Maricaulis sp. TaxID=1486257 RepID=UPI002613FF8C|nr:amidohydrolase family protein [Maricaulis sp.]
MRLQLISLLALSAVAAPVATAQDLLIENVTVLSPERAAPLDGYSVLIEDGRITAVSSLPLSAAENVTVIDGAGKYLTPGLMDSHHHVSFVPGMGAIGVGVAAANPELTAAYVEQQPRSLLYHGVTQILDPSPLNAWQTFEDQPVRPDFFRCGEIPTPGGYPGNQLGEGERAALSSYEIDPALEGEAARVTREIAEDGAICVKIYVEDGFGDANAWPVFDTALIRELVDAAHDYGLPVVAHANAVDMYRHALDGGVDIMAHGMWNWNWPDGEAPVVETLDRLVADAVGYMPTHMVMTGISRHMLQGTLDDPGFLNVVPPSLMAFYRAGGSDFFSEELASDFPPEMPAEEVGSILGYGVGRAQAATGYLHQRGHPILLASDCPGSPTFANHAGLCTLREMISIAEGGVSLAAVFEAGTINNVRRFGLEADYGTVVPGKIANLLLLRANPLETVEAWDSIETVILHGRPIQRESLRAGQTSSN